jgi:hypothetical protein
MTDGYRVGDPHPAAEITAAIRLGLTPLRLERAYRMGRLPQLAREFGVDIAAVDLLVRRWILEDDTCR